MNLKRAQGSPDVALIECINPVKQKWRVRWDLQTRTDGTTDYMEAEFTHHPSTDEIRNLVHQWCNEQTDADILNGFLFEGHLVWLSSQNQFNYQTAYNAAKQTEGRTLPVTFKFGTDEDPVYRTFSTLEDLETFATAALTHVQHALQLGWQRKDSFDLSLYV